MFMDNINRFDSAVSNLTPMLSGLFLGLDSRDKQRIREIRLRSRRKAAVITDRGTEFILPSGRLTSVYSELAVETNEDEIGEIFRRLCGYSVYSCTESVNKGYITVSGGHRAGVAGTAVTENGKITAVRDICSINLRIAREIKGAANGIYKSVFANGLCSVIVVGPPSSGKTTVLRDLARQLSGKDSGNCRKVFVCDERGELGACVSGIPQNDLGINTDIITGYPKSEGIMTGLRSFSPDIIICDEVATYEEIDAVESGVNSGVCFALSVHARNVRELKTKPIIKRLIATGEFGKIVLLSGNGVCRTEKIFDAGELDV